MTPRPARKVFFNFVRIRCDIEKLKTHIQIILIDFGSISFSIKIDFKRGLVMFSIYLPRFYPFPPTAVLNYDS